MAKSKTVFICQECGYESSGWLGKCPACMQWNTFVEERQEAATKSATGAAGIIRPVSLGDIQTGNDDRRRTASETRAFFRSREFPMYPVL